VGADRKVLFLAALICDLAGRHSGEAQGVIGLAVSDHRRYVLMQLACD
jgi:hypothetical protein